VKRADQAEVLVHTIPTPLTIAARGLYPVTSSPANQDLPFIGQNGAGQYAHEGALARPVLADEHVDLAAAHGQGMRSLAVSAPYRFVTDRSSTATSVAAALAGSADAALTSTGDLRFRHVWGVGGHAGAAGAGAGGPRPESVRT